MVRLSLVPFGLLTPSLALSPVADANEPWTNFLVFDAHYLPMAKCWFRWFEQNASPQPLKVGCMDARSCAEARNWQAPLQSKVSHMEVLNEVDTSLLTRRAEARGAAAKRALEVKSEGTVLPRQMIRSEASEDAASQEAGDGQWPRNNYIHMYHRMIWDTLEQHQRAILHLDIDALWLKSPDQYLQKVLRKHPDADIVVSSSTEANPLSLREKWGFVLNVGFILYRYTDKVKALFEEDLLPAKHQSCQQLLNFALDKKGCTWRSNDTNTSDTFGKCGGLKVVALSQSFVSRSVDLSYSPEALPKLPAIAHPDTGLLTMTGISRMKKFRDMNLCS
ncbi:unnamed protein product [Effrenium voratum]|uniref:Nucleotide-diphospho-sugar transferase domain-containing protein n=1 Tax=Effrenium voratum TaxID=2562239 RepID=A0AA36HRG3_9DINO|nr:unnamed protein product [Effrenium voratum]CAJ1413976.1 unnamed protein product [Effrenium voratum]